MFRVPGSRFSDTVTDALAGHSQENPPLLPFLTNRVSATVPQAAARAAQGGERGAPLCRPRATAWAARHCYLQTPSEASTCIF